MRGNERGKVADAQARRSGKPPDDRRITIIRKELDTVVEKLDVLAGDRPKARARSAIRRSDVANLTMESQPISASPTADDFNALRADVAAILNALQRL